MMPSSRLALRLAGTTGKYFPELRILCPVPNVLGVEMRLAFAAANEERAMRRTVIRYKAKPEMADRNAELVAKVFAELKAAQPEGLRYLSLRLEDDTFIHFVETAADDGSSPLPKLSAFAAFQNGIRERCAEPPVPKGATIVGNYRMLGED
jgi:hypothetical protein